MNSARFSIALHCESFDDFPTRLSADDASSLLKCWTALWHPSLLSCSKAGPDIWCVGSSFNSGDSDDAEARAVVVPSFAADEYEQAKEGMAGTHAFCLDSPDSTRSDIVAQLMASFTMEPTHQPDAVHADSLERLAFDFFALGYAWLQVRLMTLHVRYSTNLDDDGFNRELIEAAVAWSEGLLDTATEKMTRCFDLLLEEKNSYYSVEPNLLDLVLIEPSTLGAKLDAQLACRHHVNLLLSGQTVERIGFEKPVAAGIIRTRLTDGSLTVVGGLQRELPSSLIPLESQLRQFHSARETFDRHLKTRPRTFARRQFGLTSMTPAFLEQLDFYGACHMTLDGGKLPDVHGFTLRWVGEDGQTVPALATAPLDAGDSRSFLDLGVRIANQIDAEHAAALVFAHWPDRVCDTFMDLVRMTQYGALFGEFVGFDDYFESAYDPGYGEPFTAEQYESPGLSRQLQRGQTDPISRYINYWRLHAGVVECNFLLTMFAFTSQNDKPLIASDIVQWKQAIASLTDTIDQLFDDPMTALNTSQVVEESEIAIESLQREIAVCCLSGGAADSESERAVFAVNATGVSGALFLSDGGIVDIPAMGWASAAAREMHRAKSLTGPPVDDGLTLRNEFFQVTVDEATGGIRSLQTYDQRQTQASQRLSIRIPDGTQRYVYADMVADNVSVDRLSPVESRIVSVGRLTDPRTGNAVCKFAQTLSLRRKDPFADLQIELLDLDGVSEDFNHYVCSRLAWFDESSSVYYGASEIRSRSTNQWVEAPVYVRVEQPDHSITLLSRGLPWHRRSARNRLDTLLVVGKERQRKFRLSLGADCANDLNNSIVRFSPPRKIECSQGLHSKDGWLFHFSNKTIAVVFCEPLLHEGLVAGVRWRLVETQGRRGKLKISCPFKVERAERMMFDGRTAEALAFDKHVVEVDFTRNEYFEVHVFSAFDT